ncbi:TRI16 protein, partial [Polypterus senegalus]
MERLRQEVKLELRQVLGKIEERIQENSKQLGVTLSDIKRKLEEREKTLKETRRMMDKMKMSVVREVEENEKSFTALIRCIEEAHRKLTERIKEQEKREMEKAEGVMEQMEKEIEELKRREAELKELSKTKDHLHYLQTFSSRCVLPADGDSLSFTVTAEFSSEDLRKELSGLIKSLEKISQGDIMTRTPPDHEAPVFALQPPEPQSTDDFLKYFCPLTLDINTAHRKLRLSEGNKKVTRERTETEYPDHPDRFDIYAQVLCREALTGTRCYWEVECSGDVMRIGVAYKVLSRKGGFWECCLGNNDKSWCLRCSHSQYSVRHNKQKTEISAPYSPTIDMLSPDELFTADLSPSVLFSLLSPRPLLQSPLCDLIKSLVCLVTQVLVTAAHWQSFKLYRLTAMLSCRLMFVLVEVVSC